MDTLPLGELSALCSAFLWSLNATLLRPLSATVPALRITSLQYAVVAVFTFVVALALGRLPAALEIPALQAAALVGAALLGMAAGDTAYVRALGTMGVARSFTVATTGYIFLAFALAAVVLGEPVTFRRLAGACLLVMGLWVVVRSKDRGVGAVAPAGALGTGLVFAGIAAVCWAATTTAMKPALSDVDVLAANVLRIPAVALALNAVNLAHHGFPMRAYNRRMVLVAGVAGILGMGIGSLCFLYAIQAAGAAKTAVLSSTSPLFAAALAVLVLRERLTRAVAVGTALSVAGTWLVV